MLPELPQLTLYLGAAFILLVTPGPAVLYVIACSLEHGWTAGVISSLGLGTGAAVQVAATAAGLSAVLASSVVAFSVVKYAGAAYLIWLGIQRLRQRRDDSLESGLRPPSSLGRLYLDGVVVNLLNPKSALFFLAFLPQFVDPTRGAAAAQVVVLGLLFILLAVLTDSLYAVAAGSLADLLRRRPTVARRVDRATGGLLIVLGLAAAWSGRAR